MKPSANSRRRRPSRLPHPPRPAPTALPQRLAAREPSIRMPSSLWSASSLSWSEIIAAVSDDATTMNAILGGRCWPMPLDLCPSCSCSSDSRRVYCGRVRDQVTDVEMLHGEEGSGVYSRLQPSVPYVSPQASTSEGWWSHSL